MDFALLNLALFLYYTRPFEWISLVAVLRPMLVVMLAAIFAMVQRPDGFEIGSLAKTPHDRAMLAFFAYLIVTAADVGAAMSDSLTLYGFYVVSVHALCNARRLNLFLGLWCAAMVGVAIMALLSLVGIDPLDSRHLTDGQMRGRLVLNTSLLSNPNALGHNVAPSVAALYYLQVWRGSPLGLAKWAISSLLVFLCIYHTQSKGAVLCLGGAFLLAQCFERPKWVQAAILLFAVTAGVAGVKLLPRMEGLQNSKHDEGIQGRVEAFKFGLYLMDTRLTGVGMKRFPEERRRVYGLPFASHSAYVAYGSELGRPGLALFLAISYAGFRTLMNRQGLSLEQDRVRRALYGLLVAHLVSCWMITFQYHIPFFLLMGCIGGYHRLLLTGRGVVDPVASSQAPPSQSGNGTPSRPLTPVGLSTDIPGANRRPRELVADAAAVGVWNRFSWWDILAVLVVLYGVEQFWRYSVRNL